MQRPFCPPRRFFSERRLPLYPDLLSLHVANPRRYPFLLESTLQTGQGPGQNQSRYDILFAFPEGRLVLETSGRLTLEERPIPGGAFLRELDNWLAREGPDGAAAGPKARDRPGASGWDGPDVPFRGGWFLYLGYELAGQIEPVLAPAFSESLRAGASTVEAQFPVASAWRIPAAIIRDRQRRETILVAEPECAARLKELEEDIRRAAAGSGTEWFLSRPIALAEPLREDPADTFLTDAARIKRYIREGDVFQSNLSRGWRGHLPEGIAPWRIYHRLRQQNPGAFAGIAVWDDLAILSSSPERLVHIRDGVVQTRPIAGTHPRNPDSVADQGLSRALLSHPKEQAEHIMLIDLERNDLGRVCRPGSVRVDELMVLESYAHVHHIVSNIRGRLAPDATPGKVLGAVFPGGTITGCPKVRCMEIINALEQPPRGPYTGAMGYLNRDGDADLNILIRTLCRHGDRISLRTGAGIVADSVPERELEETRHKARGPLGVFSTRSR
uniref:Anthranilate synthase component 1 n=1 Tax=Candidatus Kentrum sp. DK TaxID=2126562 RepID=A0A450SZ27_9GAMM|nr:MAG: anthranilate synthase component 1 [Candidatus Kentron sp. DK]